jgi:hypothetical protein
MSKNMDSWYRKQPKGGEHVSDIGASSSVGESHGSSAVKKRVRKYQTDFLAFGFNYQLMKR